MVRGYVELPPHLPDELLIPTQITSVRKLEEGFCHRTTEKLDSKTLGKAKLHYGSRFQGPYRGAEDRKVDKG